MYSAEKFDVSTLNWVKGEIDETLKQARIALETFAENGDDANQLQFCISYLHQVAGTLQMVELRGAAKFASEIEHVAVALQQGKVTDRDAAFEVLMRAILQLPDYLESLQSGAGDNPIVLLALLNELRQARGDKALSESVFFNPDLTVMPSLAAASPAGNLQPLARKLRSYYQASLLKLLHGEDVAPQLNTIGTVIDKLFNAVGQAQLRQWLWILHGFVEGVRDGGIPLDAEQKQMLGKSDQLFRHLVEHGEEGVKSEHMAVLNRTMLFQIAKSASRGRRVSELRDAFHLDRLVPESIQTGQALLGGFNAELKRTVASDVLLELGRVKDAFDIFVRSERRETAGLVALGDSLLTLAETLVLLRQDDLSQQLRQQSLVLRRLAAGELPPEDTTLMGVAGAILAVESSLGDWGNNAPVEQADDLAGQVSGDELGQQAEAEHRRVIRQVMKEARDGVIRVRESLSQYLESPGDKSHLAGVPALLHEIVGSLTMLSYRRVAQVLRACGEFVSNDLIKAQTVPPAERLDALADAIMSIEYYLEAFVQSRVHPGSVLEVAERGVAELGYPIDTVAAPAASGADVALAAHAASEEPEFTMPPLEEEFAVAAVAAELAPRRPPAPAASVASDAAEIISLNVETLPPLAAHQAKASSAPVPFHKPAISDVDDEIIEIFIEEAEEELANIARLLPVWSDNPADEESLRDLRRCFHTLKGSGRLVGASALGEFAWAFESMLNRIIDGTLRPGPAVFDMLDQAREALAQLVANFKTGTPLSDEVEMLRESAQEMVQPGGMRLSSPPPAAKPSAAAAIAQPVASPAPPPERLELDPVLLEIYSKETEGHLEQLQAFIDNYAQGSHRANEPLIRALHTLTGSSRMAGIYPVSEVTTLLERYAKTIQLERMAMTGEGVTLLRECKTFIQQILAHLLDGDASPLPSNSDLVAQAAALYATVQHAEESVAARPEEGLATVPEDAAPEVVESVALPLTADAPTQAEQPIPVAPEEAFDFGGDLPWGDGPLVVEEAAEVNPSADDLERALEILEQSVPVAEVSVVAQPVPAVTEEPVFTPAPPPRSRSAVAAEEFDPELLEIFLEEGRDILNDSEETLHAWVNNPNDRSLMEALQRQLHTLKGGARMAGISAIGDLGHSLESTLDAVVEGRLARSKRMMDLLQLAHDRLVVMLEQVRNHQPLSSGDDLIDEIFALGRGTTGDAQVASIAAAQKTREQAALEIRVEEIVEPFAAVNDQLQPAQPHIDPLELLISTGKDRIDRIVDKSFAWRRAADDMAVMQEIRAEAQALMHEAGAAVIVELTELAKGIVDLLKAVDDGHVPIAEKTFTLLDAAGERLALIFGQLTQRLSLSNGLYLISAIDELIKSSIAEQRAAVGLSLEASEPEQARAASGEKSADTEGDSEENRRRGGRVQHEMVRVRADLLDNMVNFAGEVSIYRSRVEQQLGSMRFNIDDLDQTVTRLREQVRQFDIETEAQIDSRFRETVGTDYDDFDPLEFDRFTHMQQLSRSMMESLNDLQSIEDMMLNLSRESETLLLQQSRVNTELQETLMHTRMVPLVEHAPRLRRIVRQTCAELKKETSLTFKGADVEMDRNVVERILAPLEHMLRNSVAHGIESADKRIAAGKPAEGAITVALSREGAEIVIRVSDDGGGINLDAVRKKALDKGMMTPAAKLSDKEVMHFILESGFSTAETLSQIAGRGVGMDVVASEIKQLGGVLEIDSVPGKGTLFTVRLPLTLSVSRALLVYGGEDIYAIPLMSISGIERIAKKELEQLLASESPQYRWVGQNYELMHLSRVLGVTTLPPPQEGDKISLLLAQSGDNRVALAVDGLVGNREIVVKSLGAQLSTLQDISGATILADGHVALIIDLPALIRRGLAKRVSGALVIEALPEVEAVPTVMVVDDSITVRKVTERLLKRHNMKCVTAKDGVDALTVLEDVAPDVMLLDIEMPRMDGYELATHLRNSERFRHLPIIMITSRTGDKHRQRAMDIGVDVYMGKPYTEVDLLANIDKLLHRHSS